MSPAAPSPALLVSPAPRNVPLVAVFLVVATLMFVAGALVYEVSDADLARSTTTYGNFDVPSDRAGIQDMAPGVPDQARLRNYRFGPDAPVHATPLIALGIVFAVFLALRTWGGVDAKLGVRRGIWQWSAFVLARIGVLRAANAVPIARCTFGTFPFLNCQYCEMASGACPVGVVQSAVARGRFPFHAVAVVIAVGAMLGRWICGWFCPFGLFLDLCERGTKKGRVPEAWKTAPVRIPHRLRAGKFVVLGLLVVGAAGLSALAVEGLNWFCATLCPAGSLYGLLPYYATTAASGFSDVLLHFDASNPGHWIVVGHAAVFVVFLFLTFRIAARFFCSALCPLGAALGLFARVSLVRIVHDESRCNGCGMCVRLCPMGIDLAKGDFLTVSDCIQCTRCVKVCPSGARAWSFSRAAAPAEPAERAVDHARV